MRDVEGRPPDDRRDAAIADASAELTDADLECVVGGLERPWTEPDNPDWLAEPAIALP